MLCWLVVTAKRKTLWSFGDALYVKPDMWSTEMISNLTGLERRHSDLIEEVKELEKRQPVLKSTSVALMKCVDRIYSAKREAEAALRTLVAFGQEMATSEFVRFVGVTPIPLKPLHGHDGNDDRCYAFYREVVWSSDHSLERDHWKILADRFMGRHEAELKAALAVEEPDSGRERLSPEVRRAVWVRDQGKCARCGSRERLEYDHIIPVSMGGANTERNIELLCETCNRAKSDSIE